MYCVVVERKPHSPREVIAPAVVESVNVLLITGLLDLSCVRSAAFTNPRVRGSMPPVYRCHSAYTIPL